MNVEVRKVPRRTIVRIEGDVDMYVGARLRDVVMAAIADDIQALVLDITAMQYIDSSGIALFVDLRNVMQTRSGFFGLLNRSGAADSHVKRTSLAELFSCFTAEEDLP